MKRVAAFLVLLILTSSPRTQTIQTDTAYSENVKDRFIITIRKPAIDRIFESLKD